MENSMEAAVQGVGLRRREWTLKRNKNKGEKTWKRSFFTGTYDVENLGFRLYLLVLSREWTNEQNMEAVMFLGIPEVLI